MSIYTIPGFEKLLDLKKGYVNTYVKRGKLILDEQGNIDDSNELNKLFKEKRLAKKIIKETAAVTETITKASNDSSDQPKKVDLNSEDSNLDQLTFWDNQEKRKIHLDNQIKEENLKSAKLKTAQLEGTVIPTLLINALFKKTFINAITSFHQASNEIAEEVVHKLGGKRDDLIYIKSKLINITDKAIETTKELTINEIGSIVSDYSIKRDQGERN